MRRGTEQRAQKKPATAGFFMRGERSGNADDQKTPNKNSSRITLNGTPNSQAMTGICFSLKSCQIERQLQYKRAPPRWHESLQA
jgi:hypothetical protein